MKEITEKNIATYKDKSPNSAPWILSMLPNISSSAHE
jgi:hypothetical protein